MLSHWGKAAYYGPHSGLSQEAAASHILVGAAEMFLFGNASSAKLEPEKKGEKRQHPEHFKFISYIFTQLNQAQRKKKESHVSTSFPWASPNTAGCLNSLLFVIIIIQLALVKIVIDQALGRQHYRGVSHFNHVKIPLVRLSSFPFQNEENDVQRSWIIWPSLRARENGRSRLEFDFSDGLINCYGLVLYQFQCNQKSFSLV